MVNGLSGQRMLIGLAIGIAVLIFLVLKTKVQAFLALIICRRDASGKYYA